MIFKSYIVSATNVKWNCQSKIFEASNDDKSSITTSYSMMIFPIQINCCSWNSMHRFIYLWKVRCDLCLTKKTAETMLKMIPMQPMKNISTPSTRYCNIKAGMSRNVWMDIIIATFRVGMALRETSSRWSGSVRLKPKDSFSVASSRNLWNMSRTSALIIVNVSENKQQS